MIITIFSILIKAYNYLMNISFGVLTRDVLQLEIILVLVIIIALSSHLIYCVIDAKKGGHTATPHPMKKGGKSPNSDSKSGGQLSCKSCSKYVMNFYSSSSKHIFFSLYSD